MVQRRNQKEHQKYFKFNVCEHNIWKLADDAKVELKVFIKASILGKEKGTKFIMKDSTLKFRKTVN